MEEVKTVRLTWDKWQRKYIPYADRKFIRGPIPVRWIAAACQHSGRTAAVALALLYLAGLRKSYDDLALSNETLAPFGVSRSSKDRALNALESSGLIAVTRKRGRSPRVSIVLSGTDD